MKETRSAIRLISFILALAVLFTCVAYVVSVNVNSNKWLNRAQNTRLQEARKTVVQGTIYDTNEVVLAESSAAGERHYISDKAARLALSHTIGDQTGMSQCGVENRHATTLLGMTDTTRTDYTIQMLLGEDPTGYDIVLTVDAELTRYLASLFPDGSRGAAVIYNYKTGAILAKVSLPSFDPANMDASVEDTAYYDRVLQTRYAPGSTFKIVTLTSALENLSGIENETFECEGVWTLGGTSLKCAGATAHGTLSLMDAFTQSCNITFARIAYRIGSLGLKTTAENFGFNTEFSFEDVFLNPSYCLDGDTNAGEVIQAGFGQGTVQVTPLHMAMISGAIANGGVMMEPKLIKEIRHHNGSVMSEMTSEVYATVADEDICYTVARYMYNTVKNGTATQAAISGYTDGYVCGKTGSAEWSSDKEKETNAWYTGFLYGDEAHPYAIAVVIEQGGSGGGKAAPIAAKALKKAIQLGVY